MRRIRTAAAVSPSPEMGEHLILNGNEALNPRAGN